MVDLSSPLFWGLNLNLPREGLIGGSSGQGVGMVPADSILWLPAQAFPVPPFRFQTEKRSYFEVLL
jgi:hypothetical protein